MTVLTHPDTGAVFVLPAGDEDAAEAYASLGWRPAAEVTAHGGKGPSKDALLAAARLEHGVEVDEKQSRTAIAKAIDAANQPTED